MASLTKLQFNEKTSGPVSGQIVDQDGAGIDGALLETLFVSVYSSDDPTLFVRKSDDLLSDPRFSIDGSGVFAWDFRPHDTRILDPETVLGQDEKKIVYLEFSWNAPNTYTLTNPFELTTGSASVIVNHVSHGLEQDDHAAFRNTENTPGGLDLEGTYIVDEIIDADSYRITHKTAATTTDAAAGGTVEAFYNGEHDSAEFIVSVKHVDPT